jgi:hypothetical protein
MTESVNDRAGDKLCMKMNLAGPVLLMKRERNEPALLASCDSVEGKAIMDDEFMKNPVQSNHKKSFYRGNSTGNINPTPTEAIVGLTSFLSNRFKKALDNFGIKILF